MKAVLSDETVNSYGFIVLTTGIDLSRYLKNPVITDQHEKDEMSVGKMTELTIEGTQLTGVPEFDIADPKGEALNRKYEKGYMNGFSVGLRPIEWNEVEDLMTGQTIITLVKSELIEIAAATVPSNRNAVTLIDETGNILNLSFNPKNKNMKKLALMLMLSEAATEAELEGKIADVLASNAESAAKIAELLKENKELKLAEANKRMAAFELKLSDKKKLLSEAQKTKFRKIAETDIELSEGLLDEMPEVKTLHDVPAGKVAGKYEGKTFSQVSKEKDGQAYLEALKLNDYEAFATLYENEFGKRPRN